jgi:hypothetical protein
MLERISPWLLPESRQGRTLTPVRPVQADHTGIRLNPEPMIHGTS